MKNNWTQQLLGLKLGDLSYFPVKSYDSILNIKKRLTQQDKGQWQSKKQVGAKTFTIKRTEMAKLADWNYNEDRLYVDFDFYDGSSKSIDRDEFRQYYNDTYVSNDIIIIDPNFDYDKLEKEYWGGYFK